MAKANRDVADELAKSWDERFPGWDVADLRLSLRLGHIARAQQHQCEEIMERHGLGPGGFPTLTLLASAPNGRTPGDLMEETGCPSGTVAHRLNVMERAGLLRRVVDPEDRRSFRIHITPLGLQRLAESAEEYFAALHEPYAKLTRAERQTLESLLRKAGGGVASLHGKSKKG